MITLCANEKGGVGKSTILVNLAAHRHKVTGNRVLILDTDKQGSASDWVHFRNEGGYNGIDLERYRRKKLLTRFNDLEAQYQDIFIDAGGRDDTTLQYGMRLADKLLIPVRASQFDLATVGGMMDHLEKARSDYNPDLECYVVVNLWKNHPALGEFDDAIEALKEIDGIQVLDFPVVDRIAFTRSGGEGRGVTEMDPKSKAAIEIKKLYRSIYE